MKCVHIEGLSLRDRVYPILPSVSQCLTLPANTYHLSPLSWGASSSAVLRVRARESETMRVCDKERAVRFVYNK